jgi:hypothetical protein
MFKSGVFALGNMGMFCYISKILEISKPNWLILYSGHQETWNPLSELANLIILFLQVLQNATCEAESYKSAAHLFPSPLVTQEKVNHI